MKTLSERSPVPRRSPRGLRASLAAALGIAVVAGTLMALNVGTASAATVDTTAWYVLVNRNSSKALDVYNLSTADGGRITQWTRNSGNNQQWRLADSDGGYVRLINRNSNKALEVQGASTADGANIVQYDDWGGNNQQWQLVRVG